MYEYVLRATKFTESRCSDSFSKEIYTFFLTYSTEQRPSYEANTASASHEIPRILYNPKVHYCIQNSLPPVPILRQSIQSMPPNLFLEGPL